MTLSKLIDHAAATVGEIVVAWLVSIIAPGGTITLAKIVLAVKLNVFALPLAPTSALALPPWVWYVIAVMWIRQWLFLSPYGPGDVVSQLEADFRRLQGVRTDGGDDRAK